MIQHFFTISAQHPCLPGHFPDQPIVPAVVILDQVIQFWQQQAHTVTELTQSKFILPLYPQTPCRIDYHEQNHQKVRFQIVQLASCDNDPERVFCKGLLLTGT